MIFRAVNIKDRKPSIGKWVTTIDTEGQHIVYQYTERGYWHMRDITRAGINNNLPITHWLEEVVEQTPSELSRCALDYAENQLGDKPFSDNKAAVASICTDFEAGANWQLNKILLPNP